MVHRVTFLGPLAGRPREALPKLVTEQSRRYTETGEETLTELSATVGKFLAALISRS